MAEEDADPGRSAGAGLALVRALPLRDPGMRRRAALLRHRSWRRRSPPMRGAGALRKAQHLLPTRLLVLHVLSYFVCSVRREHLPQEENGRIGFTLLPMPSLYSPERSFLQIPPNVFRFAGAGETVLAGNFRGLGSTHPLLARATPHGAFLCASLRSVPQVRRVNTIIFMFLLVPKFKRLISVAAKTRGGGSVR